MTFRHFLSWKPLFYGGLLPALRVFGPKRGDAILGAFGRVLAAWPVRSQELNAALKQMRRDTQAHWDLAQTRTKLDGNILRFLARDCPLDGASDDEVFERFDVHGFEHLEKALGQGRGVILVGSHLGAHLSATHWLYRRGLPLKMLIQRPQRISRFQSNAYDIIDDPHPQSGFFLKRNLSPDEASKRIFRTRTALRDGQIVYMMGDVPWTGPNTRPARFLGYRRTFQSLWAEFAALFRAPVVNVFCTHLPGGRYKLTFEPAGMIRRGDEGEAVERYLSRLEAEIAAHPADAVAHLLWSCYGPPKDGETNIRRRPTKRPARITQPL